MEVPRERYTGVYKFEGETLVVAVPLDTSTLRPAEFKPVVLTPPGSRKVPVAVVHLKKK